MKLRALLLLLFLSQITSNKLVGQVEWINPKPYPFTPKGIFFSDSLYGWMVGGGNTILKTTDGGLSWTPQLAPSLNSGNSFPSLNSIFFTDRTNGWIIGGDEGAMGGAIFRTEDGGNTWNNVDPQPGPILYGYNDMHIATPQSAYIAGFLGISKTTDGGKTWKFSNNLSWITSVFFTDSLNGFCTSTLGKIYKTSNAGEAWEQIALLDNKWHRKIRFANNKIGWIISNGLYSNDAFIYKTTDAGISWTLQDSLTRMAYYDLKVVDTLNATLVGESGRVRYTTDGGKNWFTQIVQNFDTNTYYSITYAGANKWIAGGDKYNPTPAVFSDPKNTYSLWNKRSSSFTESELRGIDFSSASTGWIAGNDGSLFITVDSGRTWQSKDIFKIEFTSLSAPDKNSVFLAGYNGEFVKSTDGGNSWTLTSLPGNSGKVKFFSSTNGFYKGKSGPLMKTTDGGNSWLNLKIPSGSYMSDSEYFFADSLNGWIFQASFPDGPQYTTIYHTTDGGLNWQDTTRIDYSYTAFYFINPNAGWMTTSPDTLWKTTDAGKTWSVVSDYKKPYPIITQMIYLSETEAYFLGGDHYSDFNLYHTSDGGKNFSKISGGTALKYIYSFSPENIWGVGKFGQIMRYRTNLTGVEETLSAPKQGSYRLVQNYPNPFNPSTTISYELKDPNHVTLKVYNMLGKEIATLVDKMQNSGIYTVRFDGQGLSTGIYIYVLEINGFKTANKMILLR
ncbi:MAG: YCF48-related protein [Acidobacteriota bacterium]